MLEVLRRVASSSGSGEPLRQEVLRAAEPAGKRVWFLAVNSPKAARSCPLMWAHPAGSGQTTPTWARVGLCAAGGDGGRLEPRGCLTGTGRKHMWRAWRECVAAFLSSKGLLCEP